jgi:hypothetical protein
MAMGICGAAFPPLSIIYLFSMGTSPPAQERLLLLAQEQEEDGFIISIGPFYGDGEGKNQFQ